MSEDIKFSTAGFRAVTADGLTAQSVQRLTYGISEHILEHPFYGFEGTGYRKHCEEQGKKPKKPLKFTFKGLFSLAFKCFCGSSALVYRTSLAYGKHSSSYKMTLKQEFVIHILLFVLQLILISAEICFKLDFPHTIFWRTVTEFINYLTTMISKLFSVK